jgi:hypothetical protein
MFKPSSENSVISGYTILFDSRPLVDNGYEINLMRKEDLSIFFPLIVIF